MVAYSDLFREAADSLLEAGFHQQALAFYNPLLSLQDQSDPLLYLQVGKSYLHENLNTQAEECFQKVIHLDDSNIEARIQLAKLYEDLDEQEQAFIYISEIMKIRRARDWKQQSRPKGEDSATDGDIFLPANTRRKSYYKPRRFIDPAERHREENARAEHLLGQYTVMRSEQSGMRAGLKGPTLAWMAAAQDLIEDFRGFKTFYPWDKYVRFLGYTAQAQTQTGATPLDIDLAAMADRLSSSISCPVLVHWSLLIPLELGADVQEKSNAGINIPENYRGISFAAWLDIFLGYALCLVRFGREREAYEICEAAKDAIVFYHSREDMFLIHVCWSGKIWTCYTTKHY